MTFAQPPPPFVLIRLYLLALAKAPVAPAKALSMTLFNTQKQRLAISSGNHESSSHRYCYSTYWESIGLSKVNDIAIYNNGIIIIS